MEFRETRLDGCYEIQAQVVPDHRGRFVKLFSSERFQERGLGTAIAEWACSASHRNVLRGLHFQLPPHDQAKLVYCLQGTVLDAAVDLRVGSPTYGEHVVVELDAERVNGLFIPRGFAHGFCVTSDTALFAYQIETPYAAAHDGGIRWDSCGIPWPCSEPVLSEKDRRLPAFADFVSPFRYR